MPQITLNGFTFNIRPAKPDEMVDEDNSITIIKDKLRMAIRTFNKLKRSI